MRPMRGRYAIVGVGETDCGKLPHRSTLDLHIDAIRLALADAGLQNGDIDGLLTNQPLDDPHRCYAVAVAHAMGVAPAFCTDLALGGATPVAMAQMAMMAIAAGMCNTVVCVHARKSATGRLHKKYGNLVRDGEEAYEAPFGLNTAIAHHALMAVRYAHEYRDPIPGMAELAMAARYNAGLNPRATMRKPMTLADYLASRWVVEPLRLFDCSLMSDGGGAFVVTRAERARDLRRQPVYIVGWGQDHPHFSQMDCATFTTLGGKKSGETAYRIAGLGPADMDFAEIYDCFTITTLVTLEDYGFCAKGEGVDWVRGDRTRIGGELPVNTHGGLLSHAHLEGMVHITEAVRQLRWDDVEPERQVAGCQVGLVSGHGGRLCNHSSLILSRQPD